MVEACAGARRYALMSPDLADFGLKLRAQQQQQQQQRYGCPKRSVGHRFWHGVFFVLTVYPRYIQN